MDTTPLYFVYEYTDVDRAFWAEHLDDWVPQKIFDAHVHIGLAEHRLEPMTDEKRRQYWVNELTEPISAETLAACDRTVYPGRDVTHVAFGWPTLEFDFDAQAAYVPAECRKRGWSALAMLNPHWPDERFAAELDTPGVIGFKPYYALIGHDPDSRDTYLEASIFDFVPPAALDAMNDRGAWMTLHVPHADRLGHPQNIDEVRQIRARWPNIIVVIAHLGRCYTLPHAQESLPQLADDDELYFDVSAVMNPDVLQFAIETLGPKRLIYGTDNPVFFIRGRRQWHDRTYVNRTSHPFYFNKDREGPEVEAAYTLYMYEQLLALRTACEQTRLTTPEIEAIFHDTAGGLRGSANTRNCPP